MEGFKRFLCSGAGKAVMIIVMYIAIFAAILLAFTATESEYVVLIIALVCAVFGWKALNKITPNIFLIMPIGGWLIYFAVKGILSYMIGIFIAPFVISNKIANAIQSNL